MCLSWSFKRKITELVSLMFIKMAFLFRTSQYKAAPNIQTCKICCKFGAFQVSKKKKSFTDESDMRKKEVWITH